MNVRLFIAIELPATTLARLNEVQHAIQRDSQLARLRWVRPQGIHLTLKFLGETAAAKQTTIEDAVLRATKSVAPFEVELGKLGRFGSRQSPRVLWVDVAGDTGSLARLQTNVERELSPLGFPTEQRPFSAHLTLARVPPESAREVGGALDEAITATTAPESIIAVDEVSLMKSDLQPGGAVYTRLFVAPLV